MRNIELLVYFYKFSISIIESLFNNLDYSFTAVIVFSIAIFKANLSISIATAVAAKKLIKKFDNEATKALTKFYEKFLEFLVSMNRIQEFLQNEEVNLSIIEHKRDEDIAIKINSSHFFWGFEHHEDIKKVKIKKNHDQLNLDPQLSQRSKIYCIS